MQLLNLRLTTNENPQKCYDFIFAASPQSCRFDFAFVMDDGTPRYHYSARLAPSQFFTDERLRECLAHKVTDIAFEEAAPADAESFPLSDDGIVDFLFGNPELKRERDLTGGYTSASPNIFKRLVQAHLESDITEDISLELEIVSFDAHRGEMNTAGFEEHLLDYGDHAACRCDSSVQYEFPGEIRLQIFLLLLESRLLMRRGRRRGWKYMSREEREKWLEENVGFDNWPAHKDVDSESDYFFIGHMDYII